MPPSMDAVEVYRVLLLSTGDTSAERLQVVDFINGFNLREGEAWGIRLAVVDWADQERFSIILVIGILGERFDLDESGKAATETEFRLLQQLEAGSDGPEIRWFARTPTRLILSADVTEAHRALGEWQRVVTFRKELAAASRVTDYPEVEAFSSVFDSVMTPWLTAPDRPWVRSAPATRGRRARSPRFPRHFSPERYKAALIRHLDSLADDEAELTPYEGRTELSGIFVSQNVRPADYDPRLLELPKDIQQRLRQSPARNFDQSVPFRTRADELRREYFREPTQPVLDIIQEVLTPSPAGRAACLVILGDPGSGKSALLRHVALDWTRTEDDIGRDERPVPVLVRLAALAGVQAAKPVTFERALEQTSGPYDWRPGLLEELCRLPNRTVLLLDGLDDVSDPDVRSRTLSDLRSFRRRYPETPIIVTSRVIGYWGQSLPDVEFRHVVLEDFNWRQIDTFLDSWNAGASGVEAGAAHGRRSRFFWQLRQWPSLTALAGNPLMLTVMMAVWNGREELPAFRASIYGVVSRVLLRQRGATSAPFPSTADKNIGPREKAAILARVAWLMLHTSAHVIDAATLQRTIEEHLRQERPFDETLPTAQTLLWMLRERHFMLCASGDNYAFVHRAFLEYFAAVDIMQRFATERSLSVKELLQPFDDHARRDIWDEVLCLVCSQLAEQHVVRIVSHLLDRVEQDTRESRWPPLDLPLAIRCVAEVHNPRRFDDAEADRLFQFTLQAFERQADEAFETALIRACEALGENWPVGDHFDALTSFSPSRLASGSDRLKRYWPRFYARAGASRSDITDLADDPAPGFEAMQTGAIEALAEGWPDAETREWLELRTHDRRPAHRQAALGALATYWRDRETRQRLVLHIEDDDDGALRATALRLLSDNWPDDASRDVLVRSGRADKADSVRCAALAALGGLWPDDTSRSLLGRRAVEDPSGTVRGTALGVLAEGWRDRATFELLTRQALSDDSEIARSMTLRAIGETRFDRSARTLLKERATYDDSPHVRATAFECLTAAWADDETRELLAVRSVQDPDSQLRRTALEMLANTWPDGHVRQILMDRAVNDPAPIVRQQSADSLAARWLDDETRTLLTGRAVDDEDSGVRAVVLALLATKWPDESTRTLLRNRAFADVDPAPRLSALQLLLTHWPDQDTRRILFEGVRDGSPLVRYALVWDISKQWPDDETRSQLEHLGKRDSSPTVRAAACEALVRHWWDDADVRRLVRTQFKDLAAGGPQVSLETAISRASRLRVTSWMTPAVYDDPVPAFYPSTWLPGYPTFGVSRLRVRDIGPIQDTGWLELNAGLNIFLGDNSTGKSTLLRCLALAVVGLPAANEVASEPANYLRKGATEGSIEAVLEVFPDPESLPMESVLLGSALQIAGSSRFAAAPGPIVVEHVDSSKWVLPNSVEYLGSLRSVSPTAFGVVCGYGPWRAFSEARDTVITRVRERENDWVRSLFDAQSSLVTPELFTLLLRADASEGDDAPGLRPSSPLRESVRMHLQQILPEGNRLLTEGDSDVELFGTSLQFRDLSDGYRSLLAMLSHFLTCVLRVRNWLAEVGQIDGILLIDELDLHLHPSWQHHVAQDLHKAFPHVQLIASTHSPLVMGALTQEQVYVIRRDGAAITVERPELDPQGLGVAGILTSMFDLSTTLDQPTLDKIDRQIALHARRESWSEADRREYEALTEELTRLGFSRQFMDPYYERFAAAMSRRHRLFLETMTPEERRELDEYADRLVSEIAETDAIDDSH